MTLTDDPTAHVLLVEDQPQLARAMSRTLDRAGLHVKYAANYADARALIEDPGVRFDAAVLDHQLPDGDSRELVSALAGREPSCSCLILTGHRDHDLALEYRGRGAFRFAAKPIGGVQLLAHVHATMLDTHRWRGAGIIESEPAAEPPVVVMDIEHAADRLRHIAKLSPTEREVAYWLLQGLRDSQIAQVLGRAERTAKRHVGQVLAKARVPNRASLWNLLRTDGEAKVGPMDKEGDDGEGDGGEGDGGEGDGGDALRPRGERDPTEVRP
ncbi:MAG: response regulator transcription factor [Myxococcales bacterium]|nr:response regulator transcription factor [Myxococcales bacterium]